MKRTLNSLLAVMSLIACNKQTTQCSETRTQIQEVRRGVELFKATHSSMPQTLDMLVSSRMLESASLVDAWGQDLKYHRTDVGFRVLSAGPDGVEGTSDDIDGVSAIAHCGGSGCSPRF